MVIDRTGYTSFSQFFGKCYKLAKVMIVQAQHLRHFTVPYKGFILFKFIAKNCRDILLKTLCEKLYKEMYNLEDI